MYTSGFALVVCLAAAGRTTDGIAYAFPSQAQPPAAQDITALAGQIELPRLVDLAAQRLGLNIQYDAAALRGTVTLRLGAGVSDEELWNLTNRVLASQGFTTVRMAGDGAYSVVRLADAPALSRLQADGPPPAGPPAGYATLVLRPQHRGAKELIDGLRPVLSKTGSTAAELGSSGLILLADLAPRLEEAQRLLTLLDVPVAAPTVEEVPARHLSATALAAAAMGLAAKREVVSGQKLPGEVIPGPAGRSVLLIAPTHAAPVWRSLLAQLDQREEVLTRSYTPRAFAPSEVAKLLESVVRSSGAAPGGAGTPDDRWRLVVDELTGTLIITATEAQHEEVLSLVARLESSAPESRRPVRSFTVRNRPVNELLGVLRGMLGAGVLDGAGEGGLGGGPGGDGTRLQPQGPALSAPDIGRSDRPLLDGRGLTQPPPSFTPAGPMDGGAAAAGPRPGQGAGTAYPLLGRGNAQPPPQRGGPGDLILTADEATSTIIAVGDARQLAQLELLIRKLDVRQPQVMLEVLMVSLSESQSLALGVELQKRLDLSGDAFGTLSSLFGLAPRGADGVPTPGSGGGFTGLVVSPGDFNILLRALETVNQGRSSSIPKVLVGNNQQGTFSSVLQQPVATVSTGTATTISTFAGTLDAGTIASVRPQIAAGDHIILDYSVQLSAFVGAPVGGGLPPPKQTNSVASSVTVPDGYTVAVGGLELLSASDSENRVPLIGTVPVIGELFKNRSRSGSRDRFFVFIRANVMRHNGFEDLKYLSAEVRSQAGVAEEGWPVSTPRVIR